MYSLLNKYEKVVGKEVVRSIKEDARPLKNKHVVHINSAYEGGGVTEILSSLVPLMNDVGIDTGWRFFKANPDFYTITKKFHNALQGEKINFSKIKKEVYIKSTKSNASYTHIGHHDCVIVHDPQPLALIKYYKKIQPWIWRCHVDLSHPNKEVWNFLKKYISKYNLMLISSEAYRQNVPIEQKIIYPSIDPLSPKNIKLPESRIKKSLSDAGIGTDKPIITQISRFDKWKDPIGVIDAFELIKKKVNCRLVLMGSIATDDPESQLVYDQVLKKTKRHRDITLIHSENHILVNALQTVSSVVIQKSLREGFGLTVSEALWKGTPVVAGNVGGIPLQIIDGKNGFLVGSVKVCAEKTIKILKDKKLEKSMGKIGKEYVRKNFLLTRHLLDYIEILKYAFNNKSNN
jgi:trehalose synthase